jgi:hypothetical protein
MLMTFPPAWKRGRISSIQRSYAKRAVFPFSVPSAEKGKNYLLGGLCVSSPRRYLRERAVRIGVLRS